MIPLPWGLLIRPGTRRSCDQGSHRARTIQLKTRYVTKSLTMTACWQAFSFAHAPPHATAAISWRNQIIGQAIQWVPARQMIDHAVSLPPV